MKPRCLLALALSGALLAGWAPAAQAGSYDILACGWNGQNGGAWQGWVANPLPAPNTISAGNLYVNHNNPTQTTWDPVRGAVVNAKGSLTAYTRCPRLTATADYWTTGLVVRNGVPASGSAGVGYGAWAVQRLEAPSGAAILALTGQVAHHSEGMLCCSASPQPPGAISGDRYWESSLYSGPYLQFGYLGDGSGGYAGDCNIACGYPSGYRSRNGSLLQTTGQRYLQTQILCRAPGSCLTSSTGSLWANYLRAGVVLHPADTQDYLRATFNENLKPEATVLAVPSGWLPAGEQRVLVSGQDATSGVQRVGLAWDSARSGATSVSSGLCNAFETVPCPPSFSSYLSFDPARLGDGIHSLYGQAVDYAGNQGEAGARIVQVDTTAPGACATTAPGCTLPAGCVPSVQAPAGLQGGGVAWVRGTVSVSGNLCDMVSGIASAALQVQTRRPGASWSGWTNISTAAGCYSPERIAAGQAQTLQGCSYSTGSLPDTTELQFRIVGVDQAGNTAASEPGPTVRSDNTAPQPAQLQLEAQGDDERWTVPPSGWTNTTRLRARWTLAADGASPTVALRALYDPDGEHRGSGSCVAQDSGWTLAPEAGSREYPQDRSDECRQGRQQVSLWARDAAGNQTPEDTPAQATLQYDSDPTRESRSQPWSDPQGLRPQGLALGPLGWTTVNAFTLSWVNPTPDGVTQAPLAGARYQVGGGSAAAYSACLAGGQACSLGNLQAPSGGAHQVRLWLQDAAGNQDLGQSESTVLYWTDPDCLRTP